MARPAPIWRRLAALALDSALLALVLTPLAWVWVKLFAVSLPNSSLPLFDYLVQLQLQRDPMVTGGLLFLVGLVAVYLFLGPLLAAATPGMAVLGLEIVDDDGSEPGAGACAVRALGACLGAAYFGLGLLWTAFDGRRQGLHDKIAGTLVVQRKTR